MIENLFKSQKVNLNDMRKSGISRGDFMRELAACALSAVQADKISKKKM